MTNYRVYSFDEAGRIIAAECIEATNDAHAITTAKKHKHGAKSEVWERDRLVGRVVSALEIRP